MLRIFLFSFILTSSVHALDERQIVRKILQITMNRDEIKAQETELITRIIGNITKANILVKEELFKWEKEGPMKEKLMALFDRLEKENEGILRHRLSSELKLISLMQKLQAHIYMKHYTAEELMVLLKFYQTSAGKKTLRVGRTILSDTQEILQSKIVPKATEISQKTQKELIKKYMEQSRQVQ